MMKNELSIHYFDDYCDDPVAAYNIILENRISVYWNGGVDDNWKARTIHTPFVKDENPLRAAMIIYLIMEDLSSGAENEN